MDTRITTIQDEYDSLPEKKFLVPAEPEELKLAMTDGTELRTFVYKPDGKGPFPTILMRSCYLCDEPIYRIHGREYSARGFAFVYQFCRGRGGSEGEWEPNVNERQDGTDTLKWLDNQEWSGNIGYFGCSYLALTGWVVADIPMDSFKTLYLTHYGTDRFTSAYTEGAFHQDVLTSWAMENAGHKVDADFKESALHLPQINVDEDLWGGRIDWYRDWISHTEGDDPYWDEGFWGMLKDIPKRMTRPVYIGEGWFDHHLGSALKTWTNLSAESSAHSTMRIGAWNHDFEPCTPGLKTKNLLNSDTAQAFRWFTSILRDGIVPERKILTYIVGGDCWKEQQDYPFVSDGIKELYLGHEGTIKEIPGESGMDSYDYDPQNPVISHGGEKLLYSWDDIGSLSEPPVGFRKDVTSYVSNEIEEDFDVLGPVDVTLYVSSDAEDTAFTARLCEVREDGTAYHIRSGITTLGYRDGSNGHRMDYVPGNIVQVTVKLWDIAWHFRKGTRLRLDISSSDFPQYSVHTNYAGLWSEQDKKKIAHQKIYTGKDYPSCVKLALMTD